MRVNIPAAIAVAICGIASASAQETARWVHSSGAFSLDPEAGGFHIAPTPRAMTVFELDGAPPAVGCTVVAHVMPTTRTQAQLNASTESYRLNDPAVRDFATTAVDGITVVSFTRERSGEHRIRHVRLFAVVAGGSAVYGEIGCEGATPMSAEHEGTLRALLNSLRFSSVSTN
jgi:hypothetical protein